MSTVNMLPIFGSPPAGLHRAAAYLTAGDTVANYEARSPNADTQSGIRPRHPKCINR